MSQNRLPSRPLAFESMESRLALTGALAAVGPEPDLLVPAESAAEEPSPVSRPSMRHEGRGPRVRPDAVVTRTLVDDGFVITITVRLDIPDVAVAPDLAVAPVDPTGATAAPIRGPHPPPSGATLPAGAFTLQIDAFPLN